MEPTNKCCKKLKYFCGPLRTIYDKNSDQTVKSQDQLAKYLKMARPFYNFRHGRKMVKKRLLFSENIQCSNFGCGKFIPKFSNGDYYIWICVTLYHPICFLCYENLHGIHISF